MPIVLGDEGAGVVEALGPGTPGLAVGDHVILSWAPTCGRCHFCVIGRPNLCERRLPGRGVLLDGTTRMSLRGTVEAPPEPRLRLQPPNVDFGLVTIGWQQRREVQVFNEGRAPLEIAVPQLLAPGVAAGVIVLETPSALTLPVDGAATVALRFTPQTGGPAQSSATLVLLTNDPTQFRVEVPVFGVAATGALSVRPTALAFSDTPTAPNFPPLPPGLPPTVHAGSTRSTMISNFGTADITIVGASFRPLTVAGGVSPHYRLWRDDGTALLAADIVLGAGDIFTVVIEFAAAALGEHIARLEVRTDDPGMSVLAVTLRGRAIA
jgi:hypothetical protein